jgi:HD-GYP domain-containing protein (c-di-GMP phosphodiesterase class II)/HAMP domain-containing protein
MDLGTSFLKSKIARRFCLLFILCAFLPTVVLIGLSYNKVMNQIEEQNSIRLKRDVKAYGTSLFDRMIRIDNELQAIGRAFSIDEHTGKMTIENSRKDLQALFQGIAIRRGEEDYSTVFGALDTLAVDRFLTPEILSGLKPFVISIPNKSGSVIYFGCNISKEGGPTLSVIALAKKAYLWGVGPEPLLPPLIELSVFDKNGESIMASEDGVNVNYQNIKRTQKLSDNNDLRFFRFEQNGETYLASISNLFIESRFQRNGWSIMFSQKLTDVMAATKTFKVSVALTVMLLLLAVLYLSVLFIRKGLEPLEQLKDATKRIANKEFSTTVNIQSDDEFQELGDAFNTMTTKLDQQFNTLKVLGEIDRAILSSLERTQVVSNTLQRLKDFFACNFCLYVKKSLSSTNHLKIYTLKGRRLNDPQVEYTLQDDQSNNLFADYNHRILHDRALLPGFLRKFEEELLGECLCLPIAVDGAINRLLVLSRKSSQPFSEDEISQARKIANQLAIAITNALHLENIEKLAIGTIEALARTVDAKSKWTAGHSERVAALSGKIGGILGLNNTIIETITRGGLLHDIGKIGISLAILDKPGRLTDEEFEEIKNHPAIGGKILEPIAAFHDILPVITQHHEKYDGTGYPGGLRGEEIDIRARILAVADVWDALVSTRPYREGWIQDRAKKFIIEGSATHFDPLVVNAFLSIVAEGMDSDG